MKIMEHEGRTILFKSGIKVPFGRIIHNIKEADETLDEFNYPVVVKAQTLSGGRGKAGAIKTASDKEEAMKYASEMLGAQILGEKIQAILAVEKLDAIKEYYACFTFSTDIRAPILIFSDKGGVDVEHNDAKIIRIDATVGVNRQNIGTITSQLNIQEDLSEFIIKLYDVFMGNDMLLAEINPLIVTAEGEIYAADMKGVLDDEALGRHDFPFPKRTGFRELTEREKRAKKIDEEDYSGVAGKTFIELDGDIAVLASGGGASITAVDALYSYGARPANYTEYSGNPSGEKVRKLTEVTLDKPGLTGCFVVGGKANFTRIDITLKGFLQAIQRIKPNYPIVIRRDGPCKREAFEMLEEAAKEEGYDIHLFGYDTPISKAAEIMADLSRKYKEKLK
ncbi:hypothetical protein JW968_03145 [Candidatus Woesearchaeota archaeon]|nr:hypothetical protein [Candidatus Woesearchaeota archaeon]